MSTWPASLPLTGHSASRWTISWISLSNGWIRETLQGPPTWYQPKRGSSGAS